MTTSPLTMPFTSPDLAAERLAALKAHLPEIFTADGKIDMQALASVDGIEPLREHYRFEWSGKTAARRMAYSPASSTLTFLEDKSVNVEQARGNAIIEGENLEVLKLLLAAYRRQVKCIYIDPPYNTGNDFVYDDDYREGRSPYWQQTGQVEDGVRIDSNTESDGRYHSNWLNMIYPRLIVARELLRDDGVIFVSIDDNEVHNLRKVMDEVFGEENFVAELIWKSRQNKDNRNTTGVSVDHEYVLCYSKNDAIRAIKGSERKVENYTNPDNDSRGDWTSGNMVGLLPENLRPNCHYDLVHPDTGVNYGRPKLGWRYERSTMERLIKENRILWPSTTDGRPRKKIFINEIEDKFTGFSSLVGSNIYTRNGTSQIEEIFEHRYFDFPKPTTLIQELIDQTTSSEEPDLILDFFGGSGSTAQAVLELNKADGGNRKFILVQLPELTDAKSEAYKAGYKKISDITMERVKRVINGYGKKPDTLAGHAGSGFAAYRLSRSHFPRQDWAPDPKADQDANAAAFEAWVAKYESSLYMQAAPSDVLDEVLLKCGFDLARRIEAEANAPQTVWQVWRSADSTADALRQAQGERTGQPTEMMDAPPRALLCLETPVSSETVDYLVAKAEACKANDTRLIVLAAALDATAKWNLRHAFEKLLTVF